MSKRILKDFQVIRPHFEGKQEALLDWLARAHSFPDGNPERMRKFLGRFGCGPERIGSRGTELQDAAMTDFSKMEIYRLSAETPRGLGMRERMRFYEARSTQRMNEFYPAGSRAPRHLVHVSCTGYVSPSAAQTIVDQRGWSGQTTVTHAYHMGCYASLPAIRIAEGLIATLGGSADVVHNEYCTLHLNPTDHSPEQLVVQSLFADGNIKYTIADASAAPDQGPYFEIERIHEYVIPGTRDQMSWVPSDWGMQMTLSKDVPKSVAQNLGGFMETLLKGSGLSPGEALQTETFAVHPGGPRIIDSVQELLNLREEQVAHSKSALHSYGNMSSATLPHVWDLLLRDPGIPSGRHVVSFAFGPGLTIFGALLRKRGGPANA